MTWCSEENARSRFALAISAIHWRFVDRFVGRRVPSRFPSMVLFRGAALPSRGSRRARFPTFLGTTTALRLPVRAFPGRLCVRFRSPRAPPIFVSAEAFPRQRRTALEPGTVVQPASRFRRARAWARAGSLRFPGDPSCISALFQDPGRTDTASPLSALPVLPPVPTLRRLRRHHDLGANPRL